MRNIRFLLFVLITALLAARGSAAAPGESGVAYCASPQEQRWFDSAARQAFGDLRFAGFSVAVLRGRSVAWAGAYGLADVAQRRPVTVDTPFYIASVNKPLTATGIMQLHEQGAFGLDDDVNDYLPFPVRNPNFPGAPITFRQLMAHASSITDNWDAMPYYPGEDARGPLSQFLSDYLVPGGRSYDAALNYGAWPPGTQEVYCNTCVDLVGHLVEVLSGLRFDHYMQRHVLAPLAMSGVYYIRDFDQLPVQPAVPTLFDPATGLYVPFGHYGFDGVASGSLRTDVLSLSRFLLSHMHGGKLDPYPRLLRAETVELMHQLQYDFSQGLGGLGFMRFSWLGGVVGHEGDDIGAFGWMFYSAEDGVGAVVLANGELEGNEIPAMNRLLWQLFSKGARVTTCE